MPGCYPGTGLTEQHFARVGGRRLGELGGGAGGRRDAGSACRPVRTAAGASVGAARARAVRIPSATASASGAGAARFFRSILLSGTDASGLPKVGDGSRGTGGGRSSGGFSRHPSSRARQDSPGSQTAGQAGAISNFFGAFFDFPSLRPPPGRLSPTPTGAMFRPAHEALRCATFYADTTHSLLDPKRLHSHACVGNKRVRASADINERGRGSPKACKE